MEKRLNDLNALIAELEARQAQMQTDLEAAESDVEAANTDLASGKGGALDTATQARVRREALRDGIRYIEERLGTLKAERDEVQAQVEHANTIAQLVDLGKKALADREAFDKVFGTTTDYLERKLDAIEEAQKAWYGSRDEFERVLSTLVSNSSHEIGGIGPEHHAKRDEIHAVEDALKEHGISLREVCSALIFRGYLYISKVHRLPESRSAKMLKEELRIRAKLLSLQ